MLFSRKMEINYLKRNSSMIRREQRTRVKEAEAAGVKSVPALMMNGAAFHINFGAGIDESK